MWSSGCATIDGATRYFLLRFSCTCCLMDLVGFHILIGFLIIIKFIVLICSTEPTSSQPPFSSLLYRAHMQQPGRAIPPEDFTEGSASDSSEQACHLVERSNYIEFHRDLEWNFVLHPAAINIGECVGTCSAQSTASLESYYQYFISKMSSMEQCCVPTKFRPLLALVKDEENGVHFPGAIVSQCAMSLMCCILLIFVSTKYFLYREPGGGHS